MVATVAGSGVYEELGPTVVHRLDVEIGGSQPSLPMTQAPDDARKRFLLRNGQTGNGGSASDYPLAAHYGTPRAR